MELDPSTLTQMAELLGRVEDGSELRQRFAEMLSLQESLLEFLDADVSRWLETIPGDARSAATALYASGGKRLRPVLALLSGGAVTGDPRRALPVAAAVELLHTGTLLHDDVVDEGEIRRGKPTARRVWGNALAVLSGDFCYFAALDALVEHGDQRILQRAMRVARALSEGELVQLRRRGTAAVGGEAEYLEIIERKTASLFAFATWGGGRCAGADGTQLEALDTFGTKLGLAFQILDDVLDFAGDPEAFGKALGHDVAEGTVTLPLTYAMELDERLAADVRTIVAEFARGSTPSIDPASVVERVRDGVGVGRARDTAARLTREAIAALDALPGSQYSESLRLIAAAMLGRVG